MRLLAGRVGQVADRLKRRLNAGLDRNLYYYRDSRQFEVDLVEEEGTVIHAYEIKSSFTASDSFTTNLNELRKMTNDLKSTTVIYSGSPIGSLNNCNFVNFAD